MLTAIHCKVIVFQSRHEILSDVYNCTGYEKNTPENATETI